MKKLLLLLILFSVSVIKSDAQNQQQNIQDVLNLTQRLSDTTINWKYFHSLPQTKINGTSDLVEAGEDGFFFLRIRGVAFIGTIDIYLDDAPVMQLTNSKGFDTGDVYIICDKYDAIGIDDSSGTVTVEGYTYIPNP